LHRFLGYLACRYPSFSGLVRGPGQTLIENGDVRRETLRQHHIGEDDLGEELRLGGVEAASGVKLARLERSGEISVIKKD
jgi:uncharacterized membrane protein YcaP (DUF421 family)